jgi:hypothetical protein
MDIVIDGDVNGKVNNNDNYKEDDYVESVIEEDRELDININTNIQRPNHRRLRHSSGARTQSLVLPNPNHHLNPSNINRSLQASKKRPRSKVVAGLQASALASASVAVSETVSLTSRLLRRK